MAATRRIAQLVAFSSAVTISSAISDKPALILVPGAFHRAGVYDQVKTKLGLVGYENIDTVDLPSVGADVAHVERIEDTAHVSRLLDARLANGHDVILVGNSYGATVIGEAVRDSEVSSAMNASQLLPGYGRILGLIMLSGYIPTIAEVNWNPPRPDIRIVGAPFFKYHLAADGTPTVVTWDHDLVTYPPQLTFYNLLSASAADYWASRLVPSSFKALNATGTYIPYDGTFRTLYVIGEHDNSISPAFAQSYIAQEGAEFEVETIGGDHVPMLSRPEEVVNLIRRFAWGKLEGEVRIRIGEM